MVLDNITWRVVLGASCFQCKLLSVKIALGARSLIILYGYIYHMSYCLTCFNMASCFRCKLLSMIFAFNESCFGCKVFDAIAYCRW